MTASARCVKETSRRADGTPAEDAAKAPRRHELAGEGEGPGDPPRPPSPGTPGGGVRLEALHIRRVLRGDLRNACGGIAAAASENLRKQLPDADWRSGLRERSGGGFGRVSTRPRTAGTCTGAARLEECRRSSRSTVPTRVGCRLRRTARIGSERDRRQDRAVRRSSRPRRRSSVAPRRRFRLGRWP